MFPFDDAQLSTCKMSIWKFLTRRHVLSIARSSGALPYNNFPTYRIFPPRCHMIPLARFPRFRISASGGFHIVHFLQNIASGVCYRSFRHFTFLRSTKRYPERNSVVITPTHPHSANPTNAQHMYLKLHQMPPLAMPIKVETPCDVSYLACSTYGWI